MKILRQFTALVLIAHFLFTPMLLAQTTLVPPTGFQSPLSSGVSNLRIVSQSADGTEIVLTMDYSYDGFGGSTVRLLPLFEKKGVKEASGWFGSDPVAVARGKGLISIKAKYFNDEAGVPPEITTDRVSILMINSAGTSLLNRTPFLKNIKWGRPDAPPGKAPPPLVGFAPAPDPQRQEKARQEATLRAEAQLKAEQEAARRREAEEKARQEAASREEARVKAAQEAAKLAEERRAAEAKAVAEAKEREIARLKAEQEALRLTEEKRVADARAVQEAKAREQMPRE
jgi:hypothetical protein